VHDLQHRRYQHRLCGQLAKRSGMGSDSTHWRTGTRGMTLSTRCAAVCAMRRAPHEGQTIDKTATVAAVAIHKKLAQHRPVQFPNG